MKEKEDIHTREENDIVIGVMTWLIAVPLFLVCLYHVLQIIVIGCILTGMAIKTIVFPSISALFTG